MNDLIHNARARRDRTPCADRDRSARSLVLAATVTCCVVFASAGAWPADAHDTGTNASTRDHQSADLPVYDAAGRRRLARKVAAARRAQHRAARGARLRRERQRIEALRDGLTVTPTLKQLHAQRFATALGLSAGGTDAQSLRSAYVAFAGGTPDQLGEWSAPVDPAEPATEASGIASPYDSSDLQPAAHPAYPPGIDPAGNLWDQGAMWGAFPKVVPVFTALLPNGKVLYWDWKTSGTPGADDTWPENTRVVLWDPATGTAKRSDPPFAANVFCAGYSHLPNGDLLLAGGNVTSNQLGIDRTFIYHWQTDTWSQGPNMSRRRWYPSVAGLAAGESLILGGDPQSPGAPYNEPNPAMPEVYSSSFGAGGAYQNGSLRSLANLPYPGNELAPRSHRVYPYLAPALDGRVLYAGPDQEMFMVDTEGAGGSDIYLSRDDTYREYGSFAYVDKGRVLVGGGGQNAEFVLGAGPSFVIPAVSKQFDHGATAGTALIDLLRDGGSEAADPAQGLPKAAASGSMATPRRMNNMTVLPDGTVLASGGMSNTDSDSSDCSAASCPITDPSNQNYNNQLYNPEDATKSAELWNPETGAWSMLAAAAKVRQYHSIAMLMPDGRVLTGGGGICGACTQQNYFEPNFEIFTPPYLFKQPGDPGYGPGGLAARPKITGPLTGTTLPAIGYGQQFSIDYSTDDGAGNGQSTVIDTSTGSAVLMKLAAPTHGADQGQRRVPLSVISGVSGSVTLAAPPNAYEAPPGFYLLFLIDGRGVPSKAAVVQVGAQLAIANVHAAVTVHGDPGLAGGSQVLGLGIFKATDGNLADVGNNAIRSLKVEGGYKATVCTVSAGTDCVVVAPGSYPNLGTAFDQKISYLRIESNDGVTTGPRLTETAPPGATGPIGPPAPPAPPGPDPTGQPGTIAPPSGLSPMAPTVAFDRTIKISRSMKLRASCRPNCHAQVVITYGGKKIAISEARRTRGSVVLNSATGTVIVELSKRTHAALRAAVRAGKRAKLKLALTGADGQSASASARLR